MPTKILNVVLPVNYASMVTAEEIVLLQELGLQPEYAVDFTLNHWTVLYGGHAVNIYDCVQSILEETVHNNFPPDRFEYLDGLIEANLDKLVQMYTRIQLALFPYVGMMPTEFIDTPDSYICATQFGPNEMVVEFGEEVDDPNGSV